MFGKNRIIDFYERKVSELEQDIDYYKTSLHFEEDLTDDLRKEIEKLKVENSSLEERNKSLPELEKQLSKQKEVNEQYVRDYHALASQNKVLKDAYDNTKKQLDASISNFDKLIDDTTEKDKTISSLRAVVNSIANEHFDKKYIEFAALKTYRGWEYLYHDGKFVDIENVRSANMFWDRDNRVEVNVTD